MSYGANPSIQATVRAASDVHCRLGLDASGLQALADELSRLELGEYATEFRLDADPPPGQDRWSIYWKLRLGETRLLLAHPEKDQWVGTCAMAASFAQNLAQTLRGLAPGAIVDLAETGAVARTSNLNLEIERLA